MVNLWSGDAESSVSHLALELTHVGELSSSAFLIQSLLGVSWPALGTMSSN